MPLRIAAISSRAIRLLRPRSSKAMIKGAAKNTTAARKARPARRRSHRLLRISLCFSLARIISKGKCTRMMDDLRQLLRDVVLAPRGASSEQIAHVESQMDCKLPEDVKALLR